MLVLCKDYPPTLLRSNVGLGRLERYLKRWQLKILVDLRGQFTGAETGSKKNERRLPLGHPEGARDCSARFHQISIAADCLHFASLTTGTNPKPEGQTPKRESEVRLVEVSIKRAGRREKPTSTEIYRRPQPTAKG